MIINNSEIAKLLILLTITLLF